MNTSGKGSSAQEITLDPDGRWWHSNLNRLPEVSAGSMFPSLIAFRDCTLREGEEMGGALLSLEDKVEIAQFANEIGIGEIEVGYCGAIDEHIAVAQALREADISAKLTSINRSYTREGEWQREVDRAVDAGVDCVHFVVFANEDLLASVPWLAKEDVPERISRCIEYARSAGVSVGYALAGTGRTMLDDVITCARAAAQAGADVVGVTDSMGCSTPETVGMLVRKVRQAIGHGPAIAFHGHNTFGLASANALAAARAGAEVIDAVPLGIGEGAGIAALEEVAFSLEVLYGVRTGLVMERVADFARLVATAFKVQYLPTTPFIGQGVYRHTIDSHIASILRGKWHSWECIHPSTVGQKRSLEFARAKIRSGRSGAVGAKIDQLGYSATDRQVDDLIAELRSMAAEFGSVSEEDVEAHIHMRLGGARV